MISFHTANVEEWIKEYQGEKFHALFCDPPYHLTSTTKRFGKDGSKPAQYGKDGAFQRVGRGFMNQTWDGGDIAFRSEFWEAVKGILYPGAFCMAFASTRGYHRMAVAIEDAGFIIHPMIGWVFHSGFPKSTRIDNQIDKLAGVERRPIGERPQAGAKFKTTQAIIDNGGFNDPDRTTYEVTEPATELAKAWQGHRYGMQAMKPAIEPICVFQKPYEGKRTIDDITQYGSGALWIDGAKIGTAKRFNPSRTTKSAGVYSGFDMCNGEGSKVQGRWPANLVLQHDPDCDPTLESCTDNCAVRIFGEQDGWSKSNGSTYNFEPSVNGNPTYLTRNIKSGIHHADEPSSARYYYQADWSYEIEERLQDTLPFFQCAKASTKEREAGLENYGPTTVDDDNPYLRGQTTRRNLHPTVKPIKLTKYLATLLLPPDRYAPRRVFVPFAGVSSEAIGAHLAGWEDVTAVELSPEYSDLAKARIAHWCDTQKIK